MLMHIQFIISYHIISYAFMILICAYACNRFLEGVTLLEFEPERQEEQQAAQEQEVQAEGGVNMGDLPECPDHQPSSFMKGKLRSIISLLCFYKYHLRHLCLMH